MTPATDDLARLIGIELATPVPPGAAHLAECIRQRHGDGVRAVLFYGSCLRTGDDQFSLLDFYVLVDSYWDLGTSRSYALMNALLPPNVYYLKSSAMGRAVEGKYAIVTLEDFARFTSARAFQPYFWGRFAQPCALVYAADERVRSEVTAALADAVTTFVRRGLELVPPPCAVRSVWTTQLTWSYRSELRAERAAVAERLYANNAERYERVTRAALARLPFSAAADMVGGAMRINGHVPHTGAVALWRLRSYYGKLLSLLRILKSGLTQEGSVEYAIWKVERHSGMKIDPAWREKRHPILALGEEVWRMYRKGAFR